MARELAAPGVLTAAEARRGAALMIAELAAVSSAGADVLELDGIDLGPSLEQQLFFALRDGRRARVGTGRASMARLLATGRLAGAAAGTLVPRSVPDPGPRPVVALVREKVHVEALLRIESELRAVSGQAVALVRVGRASNGDVPHALAPRLWALLTRSALRTVAAHQRRLGSVDRVAAAWGEVLGSEHRGRELAMIAVGELSRIALGAAALGSVATRWQPAIFLAFDEVGTWARLLPAVARRYGIASLDLPHAEAADAEAIAGAAYDRMAVYGPRSAAVLRRAGIAAERIVEIGAPRFDGLADLRSEADGLAIPRRIVFAAQYPTAAMTLENLVAGLRAAIAAAARVAPAEVVAVPHPAEPTGLMRRLAAAERLPAGVSLRLADDGLHTSLSGAWLLVTGWSNSVLEAAILGVPALTVDMTGRAPVDFAADGLAVAAGGPGEAAQIAADLLDDEARRRVMARAADALRERIGPMLGGASARAARLIVELQRR